jgi:uncharacterized protein
MDIWEAARRGALSEVVALVEANPRRLNAVAAFGLDRRTPVILAAGGGHYEVVRWLLEKGANVNHRDKNGWTALFLASLIGYIPLVMLLLERGADRTLSLFQIYMSPLMAASYHGHLEVVRICDGAPAG